MKLGITPVDHSAENNGVWAYYCGVKLLIARNNNNKFKNSFRRLSKPYQRDIDRNTLSPDISEDILCQSIAEGILLDWDKSTFIVDGEEIEYSVENAVNLLKNDPDCRIFVTEFSEDLSNYTKDVQENMVGNSKTS